VKYAKYLFLAVGLALLAKVLSAVDWDQVGVDLAKIGWSGFAIVVCLHVVTFLTDVAGWQQTFTSIPPREPRWTLRLYAVRLAGEAFNHILPAASIGGEPFKAALLKTHYSVPYREAAATLLLARTVNIIALLLFLAVGFVFMFLSEDFPKSMKVVAAAGLAGVAIGALQFLAIQWFKLSSWVSRKLSRTRYGRRLEGAVHALEEFDEHMVQFYRTKPRAFLAALTLGFTNWILGTLEVYLVLGFIGHPISFADAWIIESLAQLMRASAFFIPAAVGVQEGTFLVACRAVTGLASTGVTMSVVRRCRELIWVAMGLAVYWSYSLRRPVEPAAAP
jgi:putative membrane protein